MKIADYKNKFPGSHWTVVGKGRTRFDYPNLRHAPGPVIFINDAVQLEKHLDGQPAFFFAHDIGQAYWLGRIKALPVLPATGAIDSLGVPLIGAGRRRRVVKYEWDETYRDSPINVINYTREDIAAAGNLFIGCGTIHSAIHFAWVAGADRITFIGCDGRDNSDDNTATYDRRLGIDSRCQARACFGKIRDQQDWLLRKLGIEASYIYEADYGYYIPARAHFVWLGDGALPSWVTDNVSRFAELHPGWDLHLWRDLPRDLPDDLARALARTTMLCQQADIVRYWRLFQYGGLYFDCDMIFLRSCDALRKVGTFWAAPQPTDGRINNAALGAAVHSDGLRRLLMAVPEASMCWKRAKLGPNLLTANQDSLTVLPSHYFYSALDHTEAHAIWRGDKDLSVIAHRWAGYAEEPFTIHLWGVNGSGQTPISDAAQVAAETQRAYEASS